MMRLLPASRLLPVPAAICLAAASLTAQVTPPGDSAVAILAPRFPLPPEADSAHVTRFSFIVYGDTRGRRDGDAIQHEHFLVVQSMLRTIERLRAGPDPVRFILQSGDAVVNGRNPAQWNRSFVELINRLTQEAGLPYFLAAGNHDVTSAASLDAPGRREGLRNYLSAMRQLIPPDGATRRLDGYPTYAFGYGNTFVLALDSNIAEDSLQLAWAERQLAGLDRQRWTHVVAFFHHPAYSSGPHGAAIVERPTQAVRTHWMPLFRRHGVDLLFVGHEHLYEHWIERYRDAAGEWQRMDQVVTGGGGAPLYAYRGEPDLSAYRRAAGEDSVRVTHLVRPGPWPGDNPYHYVVVHVDGPEVWLEVIGVDWGAGFQPYRSARAPLSEPLRRPANAAASDTLHLEVGSPEVDGRVYRPHKALVRVRIGDPNGPVLREWTNQLTLGDSLGRPVMRWVTIGKQNTGPNAGGTWELRQTYDAITLRPYAYDSRQANGAYTRLTIDGRRVRGVRRGPAQTDEQPIDQTLDRPGFFAGASDLVPAAVGFRTGLVLTAPVWSPALAAAETRIFTVIGKDTVAVEGTAIEAWKVEERKADRSLYATWWLLDESPYMVYGEVVLPDGRIQRMTEVEVRDERSR